MEMTKKDGPRFKSPASFNIAQSTLLGDAKCGHWGELDKFGFCLDEDCRHNRKVRALINGTAKMLPTGQFVWKVE